MGEAAIESRTRRIWRALEPVHAIIYFAPEPRTVCEQLGTRGYWSSYFALRAAPLGAVTAEVVTALFYGFHPGLVARSVPAVWRLAAPERFLEARLAAVDAALRRLLGADILGSPGLAEAAELARRAASAVSTPGRALAAANAALSWPEPAHLVLWHAQTVLREHRGDGHVAALLTAGLSPAESLVLFAADRGLDAARLRSVRGWSEQEWAAAAGDLTARGLVDGSGALTAAGASLRAAVEERTDALAEAPWAGLGAGAAERVVELAGPLVSAVVAAGGLPLDNPMGLRPLVGAEGT